jgi:hypothetical protein
MFLPPITLALNLNRVIPLAVACLAVVLAIPLAARRGRVSIPGCAGVGILALALGLLTGHLSGERKIVGTLSGVALAFTFFLMCAVAVGSFVAIFFYKEPSEA